MGGAQAIAAFAFGTATVPKADRIVGPGNIYVAAAKKLLAGEVGIDFVAGPTEILIIAADGDPRRLAADMLAQAEHDVDASAILLTTSQTPGRGGGEGSRAPARGSARPRPWRRNRSPGIPRSFWCPRSSEAVEIANRFAPEHLSIPDDRLLRDRSATPAASSWARSARRRRAITPPGPITCCPPAAPPACAAACRWRISSK